MAGVISKIVSWAGVKLKYWEKLALYKIMSGEDIDDQTYQDLLHHLLIDSRLIPSDNDRPEICFDAFESQADQSVSLSVQIHEIKNLQNVNALVPEQCLPFGPALTVVFGENGSGKSGYARILGCAGFIRGEVDIFPNINNPDCSTLIPTAEIEIEDETGRKYIKYSPNQECIELNSLHVFDVKSVQEHLIKKNTFTFSPAGLSYLTRLAEVTDTVRDRLSGLVQIYSEKKDFTPFFQSGNSPIKEMVTRLNTKINLDALKKASELTEADQARMKTLDKKIAELKIKNIPKQISDLETTRNDLNGLCGKLNNLSSDLSDAVSGNVIDGIKKFNTADSLAKKIGIDQFKTEFFTQTGTKTWYDFVQAAKALAEKEQIEDKHYPQEDDKCLLCHQPLSKDARELILKLWEFLEGEAQAAVTKATKTLNKFNQELNNISLDFFNEQTVSYRYLETYDKAGKTKIVQTVTIFIESCKSRVETLKKMIVDKVPKATVADLPKTGSNQIEPIVGDLDKNLKKLRESDPAKEIEQLETELRTLNHKKVLGEQYPEISKYVTRLLWAEHASKAGGSTRPITLKYNELFEEIVTGGYLKLFPDHSQPSWKANKCESRHHTTEGCDVQTANA